MLFFSLNSILPQFFFPARSGLLVVIHKYPPVNVSHARTQNSERLSGLNVKLGQIRYGFNFLI